MALADEFRACAQECMDKARDAASAGDRVYWMERAQFWLLMAGHVDDQEAKETASPIAKEENGNGEEDAEPKQ